MSAVIENENGVKGIRAESLDERSVTPEMSLINLPATGFSIEKELALIEKNVELFNKIKIVALKMTKVTDWVDMGGNPYLMDRGVENIGITFGVDISDLRQTMEWAEDAKGRYYSFITFGKAYAKKLGRYVEDIGVCSQRDKFFGMVGGKFKEIEEVDMPNIRRKSVTNLYSRVTKRVVGLMGVTFDDLKASGMDITKIVKVEYKGGKVAEPLNEDALVTKAKLESMLFRMANNDKAVVAKLIEKFSTWKDTEGKVHSVTSLDKLSEKWLRSTYGKAKAEYEKITGGPADEPNLPGAGA